MLQGITLLRVDHTDRSEVTMNILRQWDAPSLPSFIFLDRNGQEVDRLVGVPGPISLDRAAKKARGE